MCWPLSFPDPIIPVAVMKVRSVTGPSVKSSHLWRMPTVCISVMRCPFPRAVHTSLSEGPISVQGFHTTHKMHPRKSPSLKVMISNLTETVSYNSILKLTIRVSTVPSDEKQVSSIYYPDINTSLTLGVPRPPPLLSSKLLKGFSKPH